MSPSFTSHPQMPLGRWLSIAALALAAFSTLASASDCPPPPQPPPDAPALGPVYFTRDAVSCRVFSLQLTWSHELGYTAFWHENTDDELRAIAETGSAIAFGYMRLTPPTVTVIEYFNRILSHYLIVAVGAETVAIDRGGAGPGWERTGLSFTAWQLDPDVPPIISHDVCRFYGSIAPGPNSHFFTLEGAECNALKRLAATTPPWVPRWNYEGLAFRLEAPRADDTCPAGEVPVFRLYNNGFARGVDSNHRYTTYAPAADTMVRFGWTLEGVAFCALP
jgi:hypothetical protein